MKHSSIAAGSSLWLLTVGGCDLTPGVRINETEAGIASFDAAVAVCLPGACDGGVCDTVAGKCVELHEATCSMERDVDCARYDGLPICKGGLCSEAQCTEDVHCAFEASGAECISHRCVVNSRSCLNDPDDRAPGDALGTYELAIVDVTTNRIPADLEVTLCGAADDSSCPAPPRSTGVTIDAARGVLRLSNVSPNTRVHLQLRATGIFNTEFYSQRTVKGATVEPVALNLIPKAFAPELLGLVEVAVDTEKNATVLGRIFDCHDQPDAGVKLATTRFHYHPGSVGDTDTRVLYLWGSDAADPDASVTHDYGAAAIVNLAGGKATSLVATYEGLSLATQTLAPKAGWITYVHFYPRNYYAR